MSTAILAPGQTGVPTSEASVLKYRRFPHFDLTIDGDRVIDKDGKDFDPNDYSRFKHGCARVQKIYGQAMAEHFVKVFGPRLLDENEQFAVAPFAFMHVPTAAGNMMKYFHAGLGRFMRQHRRPAVERFHMFKYVRNHRADHAYAAATAEARTQLLGAIPLSVDEKRLKGKVVVMFDDIYITGGSERRIFQELEYCEAKEVVFLYVAKMDQAVADANPAIESTLNQWYVKGLDQMLEILVPTRYNLNLRNCKFILERDPAELRTFFAALDTSVLLDFAAVCDANAYYMESNYLIAYGLLEAELQHRAEADGVDVFWTKSSRWPDSLEGVE